MRYYYIYRFFLMMAFLYFMFDPSTKATPILNTLDPTSQTVADQAACSLKSNVMEAGNLLARKETDKAFTLKFSTAHYVHTPNERNGIINCDVAANIEIDAAKPEAKEQHVIYTIRIFPKGASVVLDVYIDEQMQLQNKTP